MAQGNQNAALWTEAAAKLHYGIHNGVPHLPISGKDGTGVIVPVPAPAEFHLITDESTRVNRARAILSHAMRVGQAGYKAADGGTRESAITAVEGAVNGAYKPQREVSNDVFDAEASRRLIAHAMAQLAAAGKPTTKEAAESVISNNRKRNPKRIDELYNGFLNAAKEDMKLTVLPDNAAVDVDTDL